MKKVKMDDITFYVGTGVECLRLWRKAIKKGYFSLYAEEPAYNPAGTYCITFEGDIVEWDNFNKYVSTYYQ